MVIFAPVRIIIGTILAVRAFYGLQDKLRFFKLQKEIIRLKTQITLEEISREISRKIQKNLEEGNAPIIDVGLHQVEAEVCDVIQDNKDTYVSVSLLGNYIGFHSKMGTDVVKGTKMLFQLTN